jgi:hypothetical protein
VRDYRKRPTRLRAGRNRHALSSIGRGDGNVPRGGTSLHDHANWQMVERRLLVIHPTASRTVLEGRRAKNAYAYIIFVRYPTWRHVSYRTRIPGSEIIETTPRRGEILDAKRLVEFSYRPSLYSINPATMQTTRLLERHHLSDH